MGHLALIAPVLGRRLPLRSEKSANGFACLLGVGCPPRSIHPSIDQNTPESSPNANHTQASASAPKLRLPKTLTLTNGPPNMIARFDPERAAWRPLRTPILGADGDHDNDHNNDGECM